MLKAMRRCTSARMRARILAGMLAAVPGGLAMAAEVPAGTHVMLRMQNAISTRTAGEGDYVYLRTASPVVAEGGVAIPVGSYVQGVVVFARRPGRIKGRGELAIRLETITLASGQVLEINPRVASVDAGGTGKDVVDEDNTVEQGSNTGQDVQRVAVFAGRGAVVGALVSRIGSNGALQGAAIGGGAGAAVGLATTMVTRGRELELRNGDSLDVVFDRPVTIE